MIKDLDEHLAGIAIGINFRPNFIIEDKFGQIIDLILFSKKSILTPKIFPGIQNEVNYKILINRETQDQLSIDASNIILQIHFHEKSLFQKSDTKNIIKHFEDQIIKNVMKEFSIQQIKRLGFLKKYIIKDTTLEKNFIKKTIGNKLSDVSDINLNFSKKIPIKESISNKDINDFDNVIFNIIKRSEKKTMFMAVDYQSYFKPPLQKYYDIPFKKFITKANDFINKNYLKWLNENYTGNTNEK